jgi:soluble lytic murein transglycosylase
MGTGSTLRVCERPRSPGAARGLIGLALVALLVGSAPTRPGPSAESVALDGIDTALLERPGAALGHAVESIDAGETERAERLLTALAERYPAVADYADLYRLRLYVLTGRYPEAIALGEAWAHDDSPPRADVYQQLGHAHAEQGEEAEARAAWERGLALAGGSERRAQLQLEIARSQLRSGEPEPAAERFLEIWIRHPLAPQAEETEQQLVILERQLGKTLRSAQAKRRRGDVLFRRRRNEAALEAYESALGLGTLDAPDTKRARRQRAHTLFRLRRYTDAARAFSELEPDAENRIAHARSLARAGHPQRAGQALEEIAGEVRGLQGQRAALLAALLWEGEGEVERARGLYRSLASASAGSSYSAAALWRLGWDAYRNGRYQEALERLEQLEQRVADPVGALRARYWHARAAEQAGHESAAEDFGAIAREFPLSYYGWRAAARAALGPSELPAPEIERGTAALTPRELVRPRILLEAGLLEPARDELDILYVRAGGLDDRLALAELYAEAGDFHRPQRLMVGAYQEDLARGPAPGPVELWWHAWPAPFRDAVLGATHRRSGLDPALVYAVMREESGYRPEVLGAATLLRRRSLPARRQHRAGQRLPRRAAGALFRTHLGRGQRLQRRSPARGAVAAGRLAGRRRVGREHPL